MGWANCGEDSSGRPIGYGHEATCDHPGCNAKIHRGLAFKCGPMHGDNAGLTCEGYFCDAHAGIYETAPDTFARTELGAVVRLCADCAVHLANEMESDDA